MGRCLATLAKTYVHAMNNDGIPTISTAWEHVAEKETRDALEKAIEMYENGMDNFWIPTRLWQPRHYSKNMEKWRRHR